MRSSASTHPVHLTARGLLALTSASLLSFSACSSGNAPSPNGASKTTDAGGGMGQATGTFEGRSFHAVAGSYWIGHADDTAHTRVFYIFDQPVTCSEISAPGWDTEVADATQSIEIKLIGTIPGTYPIPKNGRPATGEADVNYTLTATNGTPSEVSATAGSVTLDSIEAQRSAAGSFDLTFPDGEISGAFHAIYCAAGSEP